MDIFTQGVSDREVGWALIDQVCKAANGDSEKNVETVITEPMYKAWQRWAGQGTCIFGSTVIVLDGPGFISASFKRQ